HVAGFPVRHTQPGNKFALDAHALERRGEETPAARDDAQLVAFFRQRGDLANQGATEGVIFEQSSGKFDDNFHSSAVCSLIPSMRLKFCTACPAAPFPRLSRQETITRRRPVLSKAKPMSQKLVCATCCNSGRAPAAQIRIIGRPA